MITFGSLIALSIALISQASGQESPLSWQGRIPDHIKEVHQASMSLPMGERIEQLSEIFLGVEYQLDPIGEWAPPDSDPIARYDRFDCLIFVEEVLALALSADPLQVPSTRQRLRYLDTEITYAERKHFMELQWIPENIANGWLADITPSLGETVTIEREISIDDWNRWRGRTTQPLKVTELPVGTMHLQVLPLEQASSAIDKITPGSVVFSVHQNRESQPFWISHVGFAVNDEKNGWRLRHASTKWGSQVRDISFGAWLRNLENAYVNWPMLGIVVLSPLEQGPRSAMR